MALRVLYADFRCPRTDNSAWSRIHEDGGGPRCSWWFSMKSRLRRGRVSGWLERRLHALSVRRLAADALIALCKGTPSSLSPKLSVKTVDWCPIAWHVFQSILRGPLRHLQLQPRYSQQNGCSGAVQKWQHLMPHTLLGEQLNAVVFPQLASDDRETYVKFTLRQHHRRIIIQINRKNLSTFWRSIAIRLLLTYIMYLFT